MFMENKTANKIQILGNNFTDVLSINIEPNQLEKKFGGLLNDKIVKYTCLNVNDCFSCTQ